MPQVDSSSDSSADSSGREHQKGNQRTGEMRSWYEKIFSLQHCNGKVIHELGEIVLKLVGISIALGAAKLTSIGLVAMKFIEKDFIANDYAAFVFMALIMVLFLYLIFYAVVLDESEITIATLIPITVIYGIACGLWFVAIFFILESPIFAVVNLILWVTVYIVIIVVVIYRKKKQSFDVAKDGSELTLLSIITMNGDGNAPEQPVMGQPATQQVLVSGGGGKELEMTGFDSNGDEQFHEDDVDGSVVT